MPISNFLHIALIIHDIHSKIKGPRMFEIQSPENMTLGKTGSNM